MAKRKIGNLFFLGTTFLLLLVYLFLFENSSDKKAPGSRGALFSSLRSESLITIKFDLADRFVLRKEQAGWQIVSPQRYKTDPAAITTFFKELRVAKGEHIPRKKGYKLAQYGLLRPSARITFVTEKTNQTLYLGKYAAVGKERFTYLMFGRGGVVMAVHSYVAEQLKKRLFYFRDKNIFRFDRTTLRSVVCNYKGRVLRFRRSGKGWKIDGVKKTVDQIKVNNLLVDFSLFRADGFVSKSANPAIYGVRPWKNYIEVVDHNGKRRLSFGREKRGKIYCAVSGKSAVYEVMKYKLGWLDKRAKEFLVDDKKKTGRSK